jgi:hypothetical protein
MNSNKTNKKVFINKLKITKFINDPSESNEFDDFDSKFFMEKKQNLLKSDNKLANDIQKINEYEDLRILISQIKSDNVKNIIVLESNNFIDEICILAETTDFVVNVDSVYNLELKYKDVIIDNENLLYLDITKKNDYLLIKHFIAALYNYTNAQNDLNYYNYNKADHEYENSIIYIFLTSFILDVLYSIFKIGYTTYLENRTKQLQTKFKTNKLLLLFAVKVKSRTVEEIIHSELIKVYKDLVTNIVKTNIAKTNNAEEKIDKNNVWRELYIIHPKIILRILSIIKKAKQLEDTRMEELKTIQEQEKRKQEQEKTKQEEEKTKQEEEKTKQEEEKTKQEEGKTKQEEEKTKQEELKLKQKLSDDQTKQKIAENIDKITKCIEIISNLEEKDNDIRKIAVDGLKIIFS